MTSEPRTRSGRALLAYGAEQGWPEDPLRGYVAAIEYESKPAAATASLPSASSEVEQAGPEPPDYVGQGAARACNAWLDGYAAAEQAASQVPVTEPGLDVDAEADFVIAAAYAIGLTHEQAGQLAAEYARLRDSRVDQGGPASSSEGGEA